MHLGRQLCLLLLLVAAAGLSSAKAQPVVPEAAEWVVVLKDPRPARLTGWQRNQYRGNRQYSGALELERFGKRVAQRHGLQLRQQWFIESLNVYCLIVRFKNDTDETLSSLERDKDVQWVQVSNDFELLNSPALNNSVTNKSAASFDLSALPESANGSGVVIALIDSAVDTTHPDLVSAVRTRRDFVVAGSTASQQGEQHGTAMAGVLVASPASRSGLPGLAPAASLLAFRGCWEGDEAKTRCNTLSLARALDSVVKHRPAILNLSLSGPSDRLLDLLVDRVVNNGTVIVAAFDPTRPDSNRFPGRRNGVLIVRAERMDEEYQNEFTAPGARIVLSPGDGYNFMSGHSVATALTSGVLALIMQADKEQSGSRLMQLMDSAGKPRFQNIVDLVQQWLIDSTPADSFGA